LEKIKNLHRPKQGAGEKSLFLRHTGSFPSALPQLSDFHLLPREEFHCWTNLTDAQVFSPYVRNPPHRMKMVELEGQDSPVAKSGGTTISEEDSVSTRSTGEGKSRRRRGRGRKPKVVNGDVNSRKRGANESEAGAESTPQKRPRADLDGPSSSSSSSTALVPNGTESRFHLLAAFPSRFPPPSPSTYQISG